MSDAMNQDILCTLRQ